MRTFVMGDIHGAYKCLLQCLQRSGFQYGKDRLIQLGDIVDRYPDSYRCVEELLKIRNLVAIKGNHDDWFDQFCRTGYHPVHWIYGGVGTLHAYFEHCNRKKFIIHSGSGFKTSLNPEDVPASHREFFSRQQLYFIDEQRRCYVHGGFDRSVSLSAQKPGAFLWNRTLWEAALAWQQEENRKPGQAAFDVEGSFTEIFIGHTPTAQWKSDVPMKAAHIYNCDTGAGEAGRLTIMEVNSKQYWQSDSVRSLYPELNSSVR